MPRRGEVAFVQVKGSADQSVLNYYVAEFAKRRDRYDRMIFVVHTTQGNVAPPEDRAIRLWTGPTVAKLVVQLGLGDWIMGRVA